MSGTDRVSIVNDLLYLASRVSLLLLEAVHLNLVKLVLKNLQFRLVVEQIHAFTAINFKHRHEELDVVMVLRQLEDVVDGVLRDGIDCEGLARASLTVRKARYNTVCEYGRQQVPDRKLVHVL